MADVLGGARKRVWAQEREQGRERGWGLGSREQWIAAVAESLVSAVSVVWWCRLLWRGRNELYMVAPATALIVTVAVSLAVSWALCLGGDGGRLRRLNLALIAVRGVGVLALSLWLLHEV
ncbi:hypothetical protein [Streptomyces sp. NBC_01236]|uniref:hypothetical protein n=1 Tax=Streptomyces sp. NBC_01236 TaxID=2903789 RepID=UPI002E0E13CF|nr:hypothetical protein OG324_17775 [Streptomyces sp. NBC_01236]